MPQNKDKLYITASEWATMGGAKRKEAGRSKSLPFNYCSLSFTPFEMPVMTVHESSSSSATSSSTVSFSFAYLFEFMTIIPWIRKHGTHPITGNPLSGKDLIKVHFTKDKDEQYICPILHKVFNEFSRIVVIKTTGNVYSYEAIESLNIQPKNYKDLLNDVPFTRNDIIWIQDPTNPLWIENHDITSFHHVKNTSTPASSSSTVSTGNALPTEAKSIGGGVIRLNESTRKVLAEMDSSSKISGSGGGVKRPRDEENTTNPTASSSSTISSTNLSDSSTHPIHNNTHVTGFGIKTTGQYGASFTSTGMMVRTKNVAAPITEKDIEILRYKEIMKRDKPAFVRIVTNKGPLNIELYAQYVPRTVENFLLLVKQNYYTNTIFHRNIRNFMIQGGDPTGTGRGGHSGFKDQQHIEDEFHPKLSHTERGLLSMANSGPNTNGSQFFITYRSCTHLDRKHSIFGKVVGGLETLRNLETVRTDKNDRPLEELKIESIDIFSDPYGDYDKEVINANLNNDGSVGNENNTTSNSSRGNIIPHNGSQRYAPGSTYSTVPVNSSNVGSNGNVKKANTSSSSSSSSSSSTHLLDILSNIGTKYSNDHNSSTTGTTLSASSTTTTGTKTTNVPIIGKYLNTSSSSISVVPDPALLQVALGHQHLSITGTTTTSSSNSTNGSSSSLGTGINTAKPMGGFQNFASW